MRLHLVFAAFFGFWAAGCSTTSHVTRLTDLPQIQKGATGAAMPIKLETEHAYLGQDGCTLSLRGDGGVKDYEVAFQTGSDLLFAELPPGNYRYHEFYCAKGHWDMSFHDWPHFTVYPEKISMVEGIEVYISDTGSMSLRRSNRKQSRENALNFFGRLPDEQRERVVSAYTGKPILAKALENPARWKNWELRDAPEQLIKNEEKAWPSFHACQHGEDQVNGLWLGNLKLEAVYEMGDLTQATVDDSWNSFTGHFVECAKAALKDFHPKAPAKLHYTIYL